MKDEKLKKKRLFGPSLKKWKPDTLCVEEDGCATKMFNELFIIRYIHENGNIKLKKNSITKVYNVVSGYPNVCQLGATNLGPAKQGRVNQSRLNQGRVCPR